MTTSINAPMGVRMPAYGSRGALYLIWGDRQEALLGRSLDSLRRFHPELPVHVERLSGAGLLTKSRLHDFTPFCETLFLDSDTVVCDRLDGGFDAALRFGLACAICECPWARRYNAFLGDAKYADLVEYNSGVLFFTQQAAPVFDTWKRHVVALDSSIAFYSKGRVRTMPVNDQAGLALALRETKFNPFALPGNWNFRPQWQRSFFRPDQDLARPLGATAGRRDLESQPDERSKHCSLHRAF